MQQRERTILNCLAIAALLSFGLLLFSHKQADVDLWGNLGFVNAMPWSDSFYRTNTYSFTEPDRPWTNHEWMAEYILNFVYRTGGNRLLLAFKTVLGLVLTALLYAVLHKTCRIPAVRFLFLVLVMSTIGYGFSTRPHLFTYIMLTLLLIGLRFSNKSLLYAALPAGIIWTNLHGAFFIGVVTTTAFLLSLLFVPRERRDGVSPQMIAGALLLLVLASLINPYGAEIWTFVCQSAGKMRPNLSEWAPFNPVKDFSDHVDFVVLLIFCIPACIRTRPSSPQWLTLGIIALLSALFMRRNIPLFAIISVFACAPQVERAFGEHLQQFLAKRSLWLKALVLAAIIAASLTTLCRNNRKNPFEIEIDNSRFPVGCIEFMHQENLEGNLLVFFDWAEYCIWEFYPNSRVFLDGRYDSAYSPEAVNAFFNFIYAQPDWDRALQAFPVNMVLIHKQNPVYERMLSREGWTLAATDSISGLFLKNDVFEKRIEALGRVPRIVDKAEPAIFR